MDRFIKSMKAFPFKGMLVIWGIFMLMGAVLFAERSGIHYGGSKSQSAYLSENQIVTEKEAVKELSKKGTKLWKAWYYDDFREYIPCVYDSKYLNFKKYPLKYNGK